MLFFWEDFCKIDRGHSVASFLGSFSDLKLKNKVVSRQSLRFTFWDKDLLVVNSLMEKTDKKSEKISYELWNKYMDEKYVNSSANEQTNSFSIVNLIEIILQIWIQTYRRLIGTEWGLFSGLNRFELAFLYQWISIYNKQPGFPPNRLSVKSTNWPGRIYVTTNINFVILTDRESNP